jgi:hypothetical protein
MAQRTPVLAAGSRVTGGAKTEATAKAMAQAAKKAAAASAAQ